MPEPSEIKRKVVSENLDEFVTELFFESVPVIFGGDVRNYRAWRSTLGTLLGVDPCEIVIVGSAAVGMSLTSNRGFREFSSTSDIDVAVISEIHFVEGWHSLRRLDRSALQLSQVSSLLRTSMGLRIRRIV